MMNVTSIMNSCMIQQQYELHSMYMYMYLKVYYPKEYKLKMIIKVYSFDKF